MALVGGKIQIRTIYHLRFFIRNFIYKKFRITLQNIRFSDIIIRET